MRGYFGLGQLSASEKQDILNQHNRHSSLTQWKPQTASGAFASTH